MESLLITDAPTSSWRKSDHKFDEKLKSSVCINSKWNFWIFMTKKKRKLIFFYNDWLTLTVWIYAISISLIFLVSSYFVNLNFWRWGGNSTVAETDHSVNVTFIQSFFARVTNQDERESKTFWIKRNNIFFQRWWIIRNKQFKYFHCFNLKFFVINCNQDGW